MRIILNSLSPDFIQFNFNYIMNKLNYSISQLLNDLQTFKPINRLGKQVALVNITDRPSSSRSRPIKKFAKRKVGAPKRKAIKHNLKVQKPSFFFRSPMTSKESVSFAMNQGIGRETARST